ncbi:MAG: hypothetical protein NVS3B5_08080 [Sphingomicrobium sp.]
MGWDFGTLQDLEQLGFSAMQSQEELIEGFVAGFGSEDPIEA